MILFLQRKVSTFLLFCTTILDNVFWQRSKHYHKNGDTPKQHKQYSMNGCATHAHSSCKGACLKHYSENGGRIKQYRKLCSEKGCKNIQRRVVRGCAQNITKEVGACQPNWKNYNHVETIFDKVENMTGNIRMM